MGETLSVGTSGITDGNGITNVQYAYQWISSSGGTDADISGANGSTYTLSDDELTHTIKVRVSFTDDDGYSETLTSNATDILEPTSEPGIQDDFPANTDTSGSLSVGETVHGKIDFMGDRDWFSVTLETGHTYHIDQWGGWISHQTLLYGIHDEYGNFIDGTSDTDRGDGSDSHVVFTPTNGGTYYLVAGADESGDYSYLPIFIVAAYRLSVIDVTDGHPDDTYPNDSGTTGNIIVDGRISSEINFRGDQDWFAADLESGIEYRIDILGWATRDGLLSDPFLTGIYDASETRIPNTANDNGGSGKNSRIVYVAAVSGTHYVAAGAKGNSKGTYVL